MVGWDWEGLGGERAQHPRTVAIPQVGIVVDNLSPNIFQSRVGGFGIIRG